MLTKIVDGREIVCSAEEEAEIRADWATYEAARNAAPPTRKKLTDGDLATLLVKEGVLTQEQVDAAQK